MYWKSHVGWKRVTLILLGVAVSAVSSSAAAQQTRIKFSSSGTNDVNLMPPAQDLERQLQRIQNATGRKSADDTPDVPAFSPANGEGVTVIRNKKLQEWLDQQQNWIFVNPASEGKFPSAEGVQEKENAYFDNNNGKPKKTVDKYFDDLRLEQSSNPKSPQNAILESGHAGNSLDLNDSSTVGAKAASKFFPGTSDPNAQTLGARWNTQRSTDKQNANFGAMRELKDPSSALSTIDFLSPREERLRQERLQMDREYMQLLHPDKTSAGLPMAGANDPINHMVDTSRSSVQPVTAPTVDEISAASKGNGYFGQNSGLVPSRQPTSYDEMLSVKAFGQSSLSPSMIAPIAPIMAQPKPAVLEIPRRKF
jgi:hypothetical protein